jgi:uncharacterized protein (TIGR00375 family)
MIIADLHIHSRFSRACSKQINIENLEKWARVKGVNLLGTGDFTHPSWFKELRNELKEENGILKTETGFPFILQTEISNMYLQGGKQRRVHNIILAPNFDIVEQITEALKKYGRVDYDGRPIFGFNCVELVEIMKKISKDIEIIPAHIFTPWFSLFGSKSGFDDIRDCFLDKAKEIHALETGLSSDPAMNWRLSSLDEYNLVSFSDLHSFWPWRIAREATIFEGDLTYDNIINAIRTGKGLVKTVEVDPNYGKYHFDGHRICGISMTPEETIKHKGICPKCGKPLTIGVLSRVEQLADRGEGFKPKGAHPFVRLLPLTELISTVYGVNQLYSKKVWGVYNRLTKTFGSEFNVLLNTDFEDLKKVVNEKLADFIIKNRNQGLKVKAGYDGVYGKLIIDEGAKIKDDKNKSQKTLKDF